MASHLISFRVNDAELSALKQLAEGDESANLVAQRLLKERLGVSTELLTNLSTGWREQLKAELLAELAAELEGIQGNLRSVEDAHEARLNELEKKLKPSAVPDRMGAFAARSSSR